MSILYLHLLLLPTSLLPFPLHRYKPPPQQAQYLTTRSQQKDKTPEGDFPSQLERLGTQIESVQDFWRYNNNTPVDQIRMRESIYLFKQGFRPVWEDRRNVCGGAWTFRVPKASGPDVWTRVQLLAIGEKFESVLDAGTFPFAFPSYPLPFPPFLPCPRPSLPPGNRDKDPEHKS